MVGIDGREPQWRLPDESSGLDSEDWSRPLVRTMRLRGHPQETTENAVDLAHLNYVHGFRNVEQVEGLSIDGPVLRTGFEFTVRIAYAGIKAGVFDIAAKVTIFGLGYSFVEVHERTIGMDTRLWTLATPIDGSRIDLTLISQVRQLRQPRRRFMGMAFLPTALRTHLLNCFALSQEWLGVRQDRVIWRRSGTDRVRGSVAPTAKSWLIEPTARSSIPSATSLSGCRTGKSSQSGWPPVSQLFLTASARLVLAR